ncbi:hypothetical protein GRI58_13310 [Porphyrobacter algicida]|uniref:Uncharacterized protein n=1 Tax=Qipengyuania algicida TaxID=1836209 RepID=A0A845AK45_9SPHN|nr:hypothetical protein [Qipengyuania algicida]MXP29787.1 hypothetical protein [Qipengyuania algicida]
MAKHVTKYGAKAVDKLRKVTPAPRKEVPGPSEDPATNIMLADVTIRAGSYILRRSVEKGFLRGRYGRDTARAMIQNKSLGKSLMSFALAKVATRNLPGAIIIGGGAIVKTLYDRRKGKRKARRDGDKALLDQAKGE